MSEMCESIHGVGKKKAFSILIHGYESFNAAKLRESEHIKQILQ